MKILREEKFLSEDFHIWVLYPLYARGSSPYAFGPSVPFFAQR